MIIENQKQFGLNQLVIAEIHLELETVFSNELEQSSLIAKIPFYRIFLFFYSFSVFLLKMKGSVYFFPDRNSEDCLKFNLQDCKKCQLFLKP